MNVIPPTRHLLRAKDLIDARYRERLDVATLARAAHLSPAHFSREFRRAFGETPHQYLLTRRLERASASRASARSRRASVAHSASRRPTIEPRTRRRRRTLRSRRASSRRTRGRDPAVSEKTSTPCTSSVGVPNDRRMTMLKLANVQ